LFTHDGIAKVTDFGISARLSDSKAMEARCGSPGYVAPEVWRGEQYGIKIDSFGAGALLYFAVSGKAAFSGDSLASIMTKTIQKPVNFRKSFRLECLSEDCKTFINSLLEKDPDERPTAWEALETMWTLKPAGPDSNPKVRTSSRRRSSKTRVDAEVRTSSRRRSSSTRVDSDVRTSSKKTDDAELRAACNVLFVKHSEITDEGYLSEATTYPSTGTSYVSEMETTCPSSGTRTSTCSAATEHSAFEDSTTPQNFGGDCYNDLDVLCEYRPTKPKTPALAVPSPIPGLRRYLCQKQSGVLMRLR
jgi:serine/threonine protein kinase